MQMSTPASALGNSAETGMSRNPARRWVPWAACMLVAGQEGSAKSLRPAARATPSSSADTVAARLGQDEHALDLDRRCVVGVERDAADGFTIQARQDEHSPSAGRSARADRPVPSPAPRRWPGSRSRRSRPLSSGRNRRISARTASRSSGVSARRMLIMVALLVRGVVATGRR